MALLSDVLKYILQKYPNRIGLPLGFLAKLAYLADWKSAVDRGRQMTNTVWEGRHHGPYADEFTNALATDPGLDLVSVSVRHGDCLDIARLCIDAEHSSLSAEDISILDYVIESTASMDWEDFIGLVYSTYPLVTQPRFFKLNLADIAKKYREDRTLFSTG